METTKKEALLKQTKLTLNIMYKYMCIYSCQPVIIRIWSLGAKARLATQQAKQSTSHHVLKIKTAPCNSRANKQPFSTTIQSVMSDSPEQCIKHCRQSYSTTLPPETLPYSTLSTQFYLTLHHIALLYKNSIGP